MILMEFFYMSEVTDNEHDMEKISLWKKSNKPIPCSNMIDCAHIEVSQKLENVGGKIRWIKLPANYSGDR